MRIPRAVKADGQALAAGTYQIRVTETPASPPAPGQTPQYERWAEFLRGGKVVGREVVTVVPASDIKQVAEMTPPPSGGSRAEILKGGDYLRLWINRGGNHYLIHFNICRQVGFGLRAPGARSLQPDIRSHRPLLASLRVRFHTVNRAYTLQRAWAH